MTICHLRSEKEEDDEDLSYLCSVEEDDGNDAILNVFVFERKR